MRYKEDKQNPEWNPPHTLRKLIQEKTRRFTEVELKIIIIIIIMIMVNSLHPYPESAPAITIRMLPSHHIDTKQKLCNFLIN
jgi:hypothetical protein